MRNWQTHNLFRAKRFDVYGFDFSSRAIQRLKKRLKRRKLFTHLIVSDMSQGLPYQNGLFEAVIAIRVIHHARLQIIKHVISEVSRITKKNGYFFVQVPTLEGNIKSERLGAKSKVVESGTHVPLEGSLSWLH